MPPDKDDIAESIDEVRGGARPISTRCGGAVGAIVGLVLLEDDAPGGFEVTTGSDTFRGATFDSLGGREYLQHCE